MKRFFFAIGIFSLLALGVLLWFKSALSGVNPTDKVIRQFTINQGLGVRDIARELKQQGLVRDQIAFFLLVKKLGIEKSIQAGSFQLSPSMSAFEIANKLTLGTLDIWITIPEGWRSEEILEYLASQKIDDGKWTMETEIGKWKADEGKLFPDTYLIPKQASLSEVHQLLRKNFDTRTAGLKFDQKTLILASLVEREAKFVVDRPQVASVLLNRLSSGMALDVDATVQYVLGKPGTWWPKDLTLEDVKVKSPYNTYIYSGVPPGPICNPGLAAIQAVLAAPQTDYLFYVSDKEGHLHYAKTLDEHNANVAKYL